MNLIAGLLIKMAGMSLIKGILSLCKSKTHPQITIKHKLFKRQDNTAIIQLIFCPGKKTVDITSITVPGQKIQAAAVERNVFKQTNTLGILFSYNPEKSGPYSDAITQRIHLPAKEAGGTKQQQYIAIPVEKGTDKITFEIRTEQNRFPQKLTVPLEADNDIPAS